jgi:DNA repair exonuclease SbcCD ATPase subunit
MRIVYKRIKLEYFKGIKSLEVSFGDVTTRISGANRTGKTTVADAITWCLFGKDTSGRTQFGIKTRENGVEIPDLQHTVTLELEIDGEGHTLQRTLTEKRSKERGTSQTILTGNVTECYIDGVKATMRDYQAFISSIMPEDKFRILTSPVVFTSLPWEEQRKTLTSLCPEVSTEEMASKAESLGAKREDIDYVIKMLKTATLPDAYKHLSYTARKVEIELGDIPTRIEENNRSLPAVNPEWDSIDERLKEIRQEIDLARQGVSSADTKAIAHKIEFAERRAANIRQSASATAIREREELTSKVSQFEYDIDTCKRKVKSLEASAANEKASAERTKEQLSLLEEQAADIRTRWAENGKRKLDITEDDMNCPTCGQPLPQEKLHEHIEEMRKRLADSKANTYKMLTEEAERLKKDIAHAQHMIDVANTNAELASSQIEETKKLLADLESGHEEAMKGKLRSAEEILAEDENYHAILEEIENLKMKFEATKSEDQGDIVTPLVEKEREIVSAQQDKQLYERLSERIAQLREKQTELNTQLTQMENRMSAAKLMMQAQDDIVEANVNKLFHYAQFRLFRMQVNGQRVPFCEAMVGGVPFADLNTAAKINAGVDIISTLSDINDFYAPIIIDNAECINQVLPNDNQNILFYVTEETKLTVS